MGTSGPRRLKLLLWRTEDRQKPQVPTLRASRSSPVNSRVGTCRGGTVSRFAVIAEKVEQHVEAPLTPATNPTPRGQQGLRVVVEFSGLTLQSQRQA